MSVDPLALTVTQLISGMDAATLIMERFKGWRAPSAEGVQVRFPAADDEADLGKTLALVAAMERAAPGTAATVRPP
jgi:hypothetical protein